MSRLIKDIKLHQKHFNIKKRYFFSLCKSIIGQQISVAAANSVFLKFKKKCKIKLMLKVLILIFSQLKSLWLKSTKS